MSLQYVIVNLYFKMMPFKKYDFYTYAVQKNHEKGRMNKISCSPPTPRTCSNLCPSSWWCHPTISSSVVPVSSCLQSFPTTGSFPVSQFFTSGGQNIGASASAVVLPMNIQDWFPLGFTGLILQSKRLSKVFSNTRVQKHQFFKTQPSLWFSLTSIHDYWKNHSFDYMDLCQWSNISAF